MTHQGDAETRWATTIPIDLNLPVTLAVHLPNGDIIVRVADRPDLLISHDLPGLAPGSGDDEPALTIDAEGNRVEIRPNRRAGAGWAGFAGGVDLDAVAGQITRAFQRGASWSAARIGTAASSHDLADITIELPRAMSGRVEAHTTSGDVRITGVACQIALTTLSGDLRVAGARGDLALHSASGDLIVEGAAGAISARTASGDVRISAAQLTGAQIQTANGDIHLDALLAADGSFTAQTANGDIRLTLRRPAAADDDPAATVAFHTVNGDAHVAPPFRQTGRRRWQAGAGHGGARIEVTTVNGDLTAGFAAERAIGPASHPPVPAVPPSPPTTPAPVIAAPGPPSPPMPPQPVPAVHASSGEVTRLAVLAAVERGEIDVEEALRRLDAADAAASV